MPEAIKQAGSIIQELTSAQSVQAIITVILTITLMIIVVQGQQVPDYMLYAWFALLGLYMELPSRKPSNLTPKT